MKDFPESIRLTLSSLPQKPGVYLMINDQGKVIYIGAASNLKNRVSSYFRKDIPDPKTRKLVTKISTLDYEIHESEESAFLRERDLIRIHNPRFNLDWKDDKEYPMIRITKVSDSEKFSRLFIVRSIDNPNDWHFGRKTDVKALRSSVRSLRKIFPIANKNYCFRTKKPCLDYSIQRCSAPCVGKITSKEYQGIVTQLVLFLQGKRHDLISSLYNEMNSASEDLNYEYAAKIRDRITQIEKSIDSQKGFPEPRDQDALILLNDNNHYMIIIFWLKNGVVINFEERYLGILEALPDSEIMNSFINQYYMVSDFIPNLIEISTNLLEEIEILEIWLSKKQGRTVKIISNPNIISNSIFKHNILRSHFHLGEKFRNEVRKNEFQEKALIELKEYLGLVNIPRKIETFDISNIQGSLPVGSMVVFRDGKPAKREYRKFKIKSVSPEPNDVAMLQEVLLRRLTHKDEAFSESEPDLIVLDGGKPQVNAIKKILDKLEKDIPVIGLAKREEEVYSPQKSKSIPIPKNSFGLQLLKQTRDEAHRFAITYHKKRRILTSKSALDQIPGVGVKRRNALLSFFGDISSIKAATVDELCEIEGISRNLAEKIFLFFKSKN